MEMQGKKINEQKIFTLLTPLNLRRHGSFGNVTISKMVRSENNHINSSPYQQYPHNYCQDCIFHIQHKYLKNNKTDLS